LSWLDVACEGSENPVARLERIPLLSLVTGGPSLVTVRAAGLFVAHLGDDSGCEPLHSPDWAGGKGGLPSRRFAVELGRRAARGFREVFEMLQPKCDVCGQPATIHETVIRGGEATSRHLCSEHGEPLLPSVDPGSQAAALQAAEEYYRSLSEAEREHLALVYRLTRRGI
jgi:hypothetical protein